MLQPASSGGTDYVDLQKCVSGISSIGLDTVMSHGTRDSFRRCRMVLAVYGFETERKHSRIFKDNVKRAIRNLEDSAMKEGLAVVLISIYH